MGGLEQGEGYPGERTVIIAVIPGRLRVNVPGRDFIRPISFSCLTALLAVFAELLSIGNGIRIVNHAP